MPQENMPTDPNAAENTKKPEDAKKPQTGMTRLYDKIPLNLRQVNILIAVLLAVLAALLVYGIWKGNR